MVHRIFSKSPGRTGVALLSGSGQALRAAMSKMKHPGKFRIVGGQPRPPIWKPGGKPSTYSLPYCKQVLVAFEPKCDPWLASRLPQSRVVSDNFTLLSSGEQNRRDRTSRPSMTA